VATAYLIPIIGGKISPVLLICLGLVVYGGSSFIDLLSNDWANFIVLALNAIALSLVMVPCIVEAKLGGANFVGAAFIFEIGYSLNILVWTILNDVISQISDK